MVQSVAFFCYVVSDIERARKFYEEVLGLRLESNFNETWIEYDVAGVTLAITTLDLGREPGGKGGLVALEVDDLDRTMEHLSKQGVKQVVDVTSTNVCRFAVIADPDGNEIIIHKRHA